MALDRINFYENEQFASADLNLMQAAAERGLHSALGALASELALTAGGAGPAASSSPALVLGGLDVSAAGATTLSISPGAILHDTGAGSEATGLGRYLTSSEDALQVALPSPVTSTWYLLTAVGLLDDDAPVARKQWNADEQRWDSPPLIKRSRPTLTLALITGSNELPGPAGAVPLYGIYRPGGGGAVNLEAHVVDLRPRASGRRELITGAAVLEQNEWTTDLYTNAAQQIAFNAHCVVDGVELHAVCGLLDPMTLRAQLEPPAPFASEWWYLYLAPLPAFGRHCAPRHAQLAIAGLRQQGLVIFSRVPPYGGLAVPGVSGTPRTNSATIKPPAPYGATLLGAGKAVCFGALQRNASNDGWKGAQCTGHVVKRPTWAQAVANINSAQGTPASVLTGLGLADPYSGAPAHAREVELEIEYVGGSSTSASNYPSARLRNTDQSETYGQTMSLRDPDDEYRVWTVTAPVMRNGGVLKLVLTGSPGGYTAEFAVNVAAYRF